MTSNDVPPRRARRKGLAHGRTRLEESARSLFAEHGPGAVTVRAVAGAAGCSHTLVTQHFGSKQGLEDAVAVGVGDALADVARSFGDGPVSSVASALHAFRRDPDLRRLAVRCMLGELPDGAITRAINIPRGLLHEFQRRRGVGPEPIAETEIIASYALSSLVFGLITFEGLLTAGSRVEDTAAASIDAALVEAAEVITRAALDEPSSLTFGRRPHPRRPRTQLDLSQADTRTALVLAATDLYAEGAGVPLDTRTIAAHAGVKQSLIYHHFESREHLLSVAINEANQPLQRIVPLHQPVDLATMIVSQHQLPSLRIIARVLVNGTPIREVRNDFPVFDRLVSLYPDVPEGPVTRGLADPRLAVYAASAMGLGMSLWDDVLRRCLGISDTADLVTPSAWLSKKLLAHASPATA